MISHRLSGRTAAAFRPLLAKLVLALAAGLSMAAFGMSGPAGAHVSNPDARSQVDSITPAALAEGIEAEIADGHTVVTNRSDRTVVILGYENEPFVRILPDGTVETNLNSPTHYMNQEEAAVPDRADADAKPAWEEVDTTGRFEYHDHRTAYQGGDKVPEVEDESVDTPVGEFTVPLEIDGKPAQINGTVIWLGKDSGFPLLPFLLLAVVVVAGGAAVVARRRQAG